MWRYSVLVSLNCDDSGKILAFSTMSAVTVTYYHASSACNWVFPVSCLCIWTFLLSNFSVKTSVGPRSYPTCRDSAWYFPTYDLLNFLQERPIGATSMKSIKPTIRCAPSTVARRASLATPAVIWLTSRWSRVWGVSPWQGLMASGSVGGDDRIPTHLATNSWHLTTTGVVSDVRRAPQFSRRSRASGAR